MYIIVGLGNPGSQYTFSRHNAGFLAIDYLAQKHGISIQKSAHQALIGEGIIAGKKVVLAKPQTFMNESGRSVVALLNWYKIDPSTELLVMYDDIDLHVGRLRLREKGSAGTHNGMRSIIYLTGNDQFARMRIGVGAPKPGWDLANYVLSKFEESEKEEMLNAFKLASDGVELMLSQGFSRAQTVINCKIVQKKDESKEELKEITKE